MNITLLEKNKLNSRNQDELKTQGVNIDNLEFIVICPLEILDENQKLIPSDSLGLRFFIMRCFYDIEFKKLYYEDSPYAIGLAYKE